jgi:hypothetical protein
MQTADIEQARAHFETQGYYIHAEPILPEDLIQRGVKAMDKVRDGVYETGEPPMPSPWQPGDELTKLCKIEMPHLANATIKDIISHPALGELAAQLTGATWVQAWWVQELIKPPSSPVGERTTNVGWHQDRQYWQDWEDGSELFTAWLGLSEVTSESGPMTYVPGSHKWGFIEQGNFFSQDPDDQRRHIRPPEGAQWAEDPAVMSPGGVAFHHAYTLHASGPNHSRWPRRSFAIHLRTENSKPANGKVNLLRFIDDRDKCPVIYEA